MEEKVPVVNFEDYTCRNLAIDSSFKCSECKTSIESNDYAGSAYICNGDWNFCPNCGRKIIDQVRRGEIPLLFYLQPKVGEILSCPVQKSQEEDLRSFMKILQPKTKYYLHF